MRLKWAKQFHGCAFSYKFVCKSYLTKHNQNKGERKIAENILSIVIVMSGGAILNALIFRIEVCCFFLWCINDTLKIFSLCTFWTYLLYFTIRPLFEKNYIGFTKFTQVLSKSGKCEWPLLRYYQNRLIQKCMWEYKSFSFITASSFDIF
jgi:hypothetical protein